MQEATPDPSDEDDNFFVKKRDNSTAVTQLDEYLLSSSTETILVAAWPVNKRLLFETNTSLPTSAAREGQFSAAGRIFTPMRERIDDTNFGNQPFLNLNKGFIQ